MPNLSDRRLLSDQYPLCFSPSGRGYRKKPLKNGIEQDLLERGLFDLAGNRLGLERITAAVRKYRFGAKYLFALAAGGARCDLDGKPYGRVHPASQEAARNRIAAQGWQNHADAARAA